MDSRIELLITPDVEMHGHHYTSGCKGQAAMWWCGHLQHRLEIALTGHLNPRFAVARVYDNSTPVMFSSVQLQGQSVEVHGW
jgi:hypothetical protein